MPLETRQPTGLTPYPFVLVEGLPKSWKTTTVLRLSASEKVHRTFVFEMGERAVDAFRPLGPFEIVLLDGTWVGFIAQLKAAMAEPGGPNGEPNVIDIDTGTAVWDGTKSWTNERFRRSVRGQELLKDDPDAALDPPISYWNDATDRWYEMVDLLRSWNGISVMVCHADEVTEIDGQGRPTRNSVYKVDAQKHILRDVTAHVRMTAPGVPALISVSGVLPGDERQVPTDGQPMPLPPENALEHVVFDILACDGGHQPGAARGFGVEAISVVHAKGAMVEAVKAAGGSHDDGVTAASAVWAATFGEDKATHPSSVDQATVDTLTAAAVEAHKAPKSPIAKRPEPEVQPEGEAPLGAQVTAPEWSEDYDPTAAAELEAEATVADEPSESAEDADAEIQGDVTPDEAAAEEALAAEPEVALPPVDDSNGEVAKIEDALEELVRRRKKEAEDSAPEVVDA